MASHLLSNVDRCAEIQRFQGQESIEYPSSAQSNTKLGHPEMMCPDVQVMKLNWTHSKFSEVCSISGGSLKWRNEGPDLPREMVYRVVLVVQWRLLKWFVCFYVADLLITHYYTNMIISFHNQYLQEFVLIPMSSIERLGPQIGCP